LEAASLEEEESVQELWARLIANAADPTKETTVKKVYVDILKSLSPAEVAFLEVVSEADSRTRQMSVSEAETFRSEISALAEKRWRHFAPEDQGAAVQNLVRLRCITFKPKPPTYLRSMFQLLPDARRQSSKWAAIDPQEFKRLIDRVEDLLLVASGVRDYQPSARERSVPELGFMLTPLGKGLMAATARE
jgi:thioesterase domain-containing protein